MSSQAGNPDGGNELVDDAVTPPDTDAGVDDAVSPPAEDAGADDEVADDALAALRAELESVDEVPVSDRVELFERTNETLAAELAALDEV